ncbi:MAG TPA: VTT domain-containing protein [Candidatus Angelobacter sp.]|nr:VTT domain-containing protein [Candidatus Angelobacter sp.]
MAPDLTFLQSATAVAGIVLGALISEDAATLGAASLASAHLLAPVTAISAAVFGIWIGDLGLYALAFAFGPAMAQSKWFSRRLTPRRLKTASALAQNWGAPALAASRFVPGTRLLATVVSGFLKMPLRRFAFVTGACSIVWVVAVFSAVVTLRAHTSSPRLAIAVVACVLAAFGVVASRRTRIVNFFRRWQRWEFWPAWLFYAPVAGMCAWLAVKYRGIALPALANLNQKHGGIIGESKREILQQIEAVAPHQVAESELLPAGPLSVRLYLARQATESLGLDFPFVLKPDVGQRGAGFRVVRGWAEVKEYLQTVNVPVLLQRYVAQPNEAGIFYYRLPGSMNGAIFAVTDKVFPHVVGNGASTLEELIDAEPRARLIGYVYKERFGSAIHEVVPAGMPLRLVEAGNHCQGCIFRDGSNLNSPELAARIDEISSSIPGFFIGRYDVRYESVQELRSGQFTIIELNGAASEATSIYDEKTSVWQAYRTLYRQWELVYRIGAMNRDGGAAGISPWAVLKEWLSYQQTSAIYPAAD